MAVTRRVPIPPPSADRIARRPSRRRIVVRAAIALVSLVVIATSGVAWSAYQGFAASIPHGDPVPALAAGTKDLDGSAQNILLIGSDSRNGATPAELKALSTGDDGGSVNTDTTMLLHVPADGGRASIISFPRDAWVDIPDNGKGKLNAAYGDGYVAGKNRISNVIGGVRVCLNHAQNAQTDSDAFGKGYSGINLPAGWSTIKGSQALAFVRQRHGLPNGDLDRIKRQQYFLSAAFAKVSSAGTLLNPFRLHSLLTAVSSSLLTDPGLDLLSLADQFVDLSAGKITYATLPNVGAQTIYPDGVATSIVGIDRAALPGFIAKLLGRVADPTLAKAVAAAPSTVTLDVLNGTDTSGLAGRNATALRTAGFAVDTVDSAAEAAATLIEYPAGLQAQAKAVAAAVPGATLTLTSAVHRVTLILGTNGVQAKGLAAASPTTATPHPSAKTAVNTSKTGACIN
jgi:anionic cell wall polymer biosynthesis LytR-Cps2A-Psr (LCP) family protein